jgi:hypothetical protein
LGGNLPEPGEEVEIDLGYGIKARVRGVVEGLSFVAPAEGDVVAPDQTIRVAVQTEHGFVPDHLGVRLSCESASTTLKEPPYEAVFTIPSDRLGVVKVKAVAMDTSKRYAEASLSLLSKTSSRLVKLHVRPDTVGLSLTHGDGHVVVDGEYADGVLRELSPELHDIVFTIIDPKIATVEMNGTVHPKASGATRLRVAAGGLTAETDVFVFAH